MLASVLCLQLEGSPESIIYRTIIYSNCSFLGSCQFPDEMKGIRPLICVSVWFCLLRQDTLKLCPSL
ncbi:hypothetical protein CHARACLAT_006588 [Characodon lateralis]|uniref:Uncharacterized protein n=1 Tax=Characodon lateralis TaxID=208331 RepID=A0ABU7ERF5_9TELE|nr:hypothetical protein [Characodon lateralis]